MFSNHFCLYKRPNQDHTKSGGPRSYFEFDYKGKRIILIGDKHKPLSLTTLKQYTYIFNQFIKDNYQKNKSTKFFVEQTPDYFDKQYDIIGFLDVLATLEPNNNMQLILSDDRVWNDGLLDVINFFISLSKIDEESRVELKRRGVKIPEILPLPIKEENFKSVLKKITSIYADKISLSHLQSLFEEQLDKLQNLLQGYEKWSFHLGSFLAACYIKLRHGYENFLDFKKEFIALYENDNNFLNSNLDSLCIKMIEHDENFSSINRWLSIAESYVSSFLDATLVCKLWDELQNNNDVDTIIIGAGAGHIENIATFLQPLCKTINKIIKKHHEASIPPHEIQIYLSNEIRKKETYDSDFLKLK